MKKPKKNKARNPFAVSAMKRKGGKMRSKKEKRRKNKEIELLKELMES